MCVRPGEFSHEKTSRGEGKELKHVIEALRTHVVPAFRVSVPIGNDDEEGWLGVVADITWCVGMHRVVV